MSQLHISPKHTEKSETERERPRYSPVHRCHSSSLSSPTTVTSPVLSPEFTITPPSRHWHSPLQSSSLISSIPSLPSVSDHLFLSLLKFLQPFVSHSLNLASSHFATLSLHRLSYDSLHFNILSACKHVYVRVHTGSWMSICFLHAFICMCAFTQAHVWSYSKRDNRTVADCKKERQNETDKTLTAADN